MSYEFLLFLCVGALLGGFINGLAGFGTALFALGWWLQVMPATDAVALCLAVSVVSGVPGFAVVRGSIDWRATANFLVPAFIGIPFGLAILSYVNSELLMWTIAIFMVVYGTFFSLRKNLPKLTRSLVGVDIAIGFVSGILGALAGLSGALPTMWLSMRPWPKKRIRGILQPFNMIVLTTSAVGLLFHGAYTVRVLKIIALALPPTVLGTIIGIVVFGKLDDATFQRALIGMMALSGLFLVGRLLLFSR